MKDWSSKAWLQREVKRDPDRIVFWALVVLFVFYTLLGK